MYVTEALETTIQTLSDGFERLGDVDSPFTLRAGEDQRAAATRRHAERPASDRRADERTNEPVVRDVDRWDADPWAYDVPFVDTVPAAALLERAEQAADEGLEHGYVSSVTVDATIARTDVKGMFEPGPKSIRVDAGDVGFLGFARGPTLAHELGHAYHVGVERRNDRPGYVDDAAVFSTDAQRDHAVAISERLRGPIPETPDGVQSYRLTEAELFADVFAALVCEPRAVRRVGPEAAARVEAVLGDRLPRTG